MKAFRVTQDGGPEALCLQEVETPVPGRGQARVRLAAAGLYCVDIDMLRLSTAREGRKR